LLARTESLGLCESCLVTAAELIAFEKEVAQAFADKKIPGPVHLSGGNEEQLIFIFGEINREDFVFSTYRNHYHALLHGLPRDLVMSEILAGRSMGMSSVKHRFFTSAIVGGCLPIAVGMAAALKRTGAKEMVWCFVGDMAALTGAFDESLYYAQHNDLPIRFVVEDNGMSCNSPTEECWGTSAYWPEQLMRYHYKRVWPHVGIGKHIQF
jgi:TPP-dependent pyruvate/acetoin dehydrogenase alpha subunit